MHNLTRADAAIRSRNIHVETVEVDLDVSGAPGGDESFPVSSTFRLRADQPATFIDVVGEVLSVTVDGEPVAHTYADGRLDVQGLPTDRECSVKVSAKCRYSRTGEGLHRHVDPEDGRTYLYTQFEPMDARRAWPCFDQPDMKPRWSFRVTAPAEWVVTSNGVEESRDGDTRVFSQTPPLSSYITAVVAGEWAVFDRGTWSPSSIDFIDEDAATALGASESGAADYRGAESRREDGTGAPVPLRILCRQALAPTIDCEDIEQVTRQGMDFYDAHYGFPFPWGSYDQVFVPEYNLGAMENPGCVTFNESMIPRDGTTFAQRQHRANVILHEMCHMWFGDLVTPRWWDDVWLKESFADHQGSYVEAAATQYTGEWASFAMDRKEWAYEQDQLPTTHPIAADVPDVEAAKNNFDGISYAKGAAVLKQLFAWVGEEAFFAGVRRYFAEHAFGSATLSDLLSALEAESGQDLHSWAAAWLETTGPSTLSTDVTVGRNGHWSTLELVQEGPTLRPHMVNVSAWAMEDGTLERVHMFPTRVDGPRSVVVGAEALDVRDANRHIDMVLPNDGDLTYAVVRLDKRSTETALAHMSAIPDPLSRAVAWSALWNAVRDGLLGASAFLDAVLLHVGAEDQDAVAGHLLDQALVATGSFMLKVHRAGAYAAIGQRMIDLLATEENADRRRLWAGTLIAAVRRSEVPDDAALAKVKAIAAGGVEELGEDLCWQARWALSAHGMADIEQIDAWRSEKASLEADLGATRAMASLPDAHIRTDCWEQALGDSLTNAELTATLAGLRSSHIDDHGVLADWFLTEVRRFWETHSIGLGIRFVRGAFPIDYALDDPSADVRLAACHGWLEGNEDAPQALRRLMVEQVDHLERRRRVQRMRQGDGS